MPARRSRGRRSTAVRARDGQGHRAQPDDDRQAYDRLANERVITRRQGQGAFVADGEQPLLPGEKQALIDELAARLAIEGLRLGLAPDEVVDALRAKLRALRPASNPTDTP